MAYPKNLHSFWLMKNYLISILLGSIAVQLELGRIVIRDQGDWNDEGLPDVGRPHPAQHQLHVHLLLFGLALHIRRLHSSGLSNG